MTIPPELLNTVTCCEALELLRALPDGCVDAVITDPPYGFGLDVWDETPDVEALVTEFERVLAPDSFFAFTMAVPYDLRWRNALADTKLKHVDQVVWVKRNLGAYAAGLVRGHDNLWIYRKGNARYFEVKGRYEDVKLPGLMLGVTNIEGIDRYISSMRSELKTGNRQRLTSGKRHKQHQRRGGWETNRSPEMANFTTVWSFLPEFFNDINSGDHEHASRKPILMFERLAELLTAPNMLIVDPFCGSGTTGVAARNLNRRYILGDSSPEYCEVARRRLALPYTVNMFEQL